MAVASAQGLDVSNYQSQFDWAHAKQTIPQLAFGIYRLTQGLGGPGTNSIDPTARHNHDSIAAQGLHRGAYHFLDPRLNGQAQARYHVDALHSIGFDSSHMIFLDNETAGASPLQVAECALAFMEEIDTLCPHNPRGVYSYINFIGQGNCAGLGPWPLWLAWPGLKAPAVPPPWHNWVFWQWGTRNGDDADAFNGTAADLQKWIEGYQPPSRVLPPQTPGWAAALPVVQEGTTTQVNVPVVEIVQGMVAQVGAAHRIAAAQGLATDGVFGPKTKAAVEAVQRYGRLTPDGVVGPHTWAFLASQL